MPPSGAGGPGPRVRYRDAGCHDTDDVRSIAALAVLIIGRFATGSCASCDAISTSRRAFFNCRDCTEPPRPGHGSRACRNRPPSTLLDTAIAEAFVTRLLHAQTLTPALPNPSSLAHRGPHLKALWSRRRCDLTLCDKSSSSRAASSHSLTQIMPSRDFTPRPGTRVPAGLFGSVLSADHRWAS